MTVTNLLKSPRNIIEGKNYPDIISFYITPSYKYDKGMDRPKFPYHHKNQKDVLQVKL